MEFFEDNLCKLVLLASLAAFAFACAFGFYGAGVLLLYPAGVIVYYTIRDKDNPAAIQEDTRSKNYRTLMREFVAVLNAEGFRIDEGGRFGVVECLTIAPPSFLFASRQYRATAEEIERITAAAAPVFGSTRYDISRLKNTDNELVAYEITYYQGEPWDTLAEITPNYSELSRCEISYKSIPVGVYENGDIASVSFDNRNMLVGGLPRSGKSVFLSVIIAGLCRCENERIIILSPKILDFVSFSSRAEMYSTPEAIFECLEEVDKDIDKRKRFCEASGIKKIENYSPNLPHTVLVVDEYSVIRAWKTRTEDGKKERKIGEEIQQQLYKVVAMAGFAGYQVILTSQRLSSQVISTDLRDLIGGNLVSFSNASYTSDEMIFGELAETAKASNIPLSAKGVGYLYLEGIDERPRAFKSCFLTMEQEKKIANENKGKKPIKGVNNDRKLFDER